MKARLFRKSSLYGVAGAVLGIGYAFLAVYVLNPLMGVGVEKIHLILAPVLLGTLALLIGRHAELLEEAKKRFTTLTAKAIIDKHWDVVFEDEHIPTCWEAKDCDKTQCPVYGKEHARCWLIAGTFCRGEVQGKFAQKLGNCSKCSIYQTALAHNPVSEISENFYNLMWALREKEDLLGTAHDKLQLQYAELEEHHSRVKEMATTDGLTGLKNHGHFQRHLHHEVDRARRYERPLSLVMVDLDFFKQVNDRFGHQKGDSVLVHVARILREESRDADYVARYGGEEFVIVMPEVAASNAVEAANRLRRRIEGLYEEVDLPEHHTSASFGVADFPVCATDNTSLIAAADGALLFAKRQGRNRVAYFGDLSEAELTSDDLDSLHDRLEGAGFQTIRALANAVDARDQYPEHEINDLLRTSAALARELDFSSDEEEVLILATKLHDIGKIGIPKKILQKKGRLLPEEVEIIRRHPRMGEQILQEARTVKELISAILYHHERWDGKGYPEGLSGDDIPLMARIVGLLDAYRAMRCERPYRKALTVSETIAELRASAGSQFDPRLVDILVRQLAEEEGRGLRQAG